MPGTDLRGKRVFSDGAEPTHEPHDQDSAGAGRGIGLSITTVLSAILVAVPVVWAVVYLTQAAELGIGFVSLLGVLLVVMVGFGLLLVRGLFRV